MRTAPKTDEDYRDWIRRRPCLLELLPPLGGHTCEGGVEPHHVHARRRFGDWLEEGSGNLLPLDHGAHRELHQIGRETWERKYDIDLEKQAWRLGSIYLWKERVND